jgi:CheY-like chemotaxis protein
VLSDINMPGMDGMELLCEIKQRRPDLPVMMVTAYGDDERRHRALNSVLSSSSRSRSISISWKEQLRQLPTEAD